MFDLNPRRGREQRGVRPCLVVSTDALNRSDFGTVILCPITTRKRNTFRWRVGLVTEDLAVADSSWAPKPHWVETDQVVTVDTRRRAVRHLATVISVGKLQRVDDSLRMMLDL